MRTFVLVSIFYVVFNSRESLLVHILFFKPLNDCLSATGPGRDNGTFYVETRSTQYKAGVFTVERLVRIGRKNY